MNLGAPASYFAYQTIFSGFLIVYRHLIRHKLVSLMCLHRGFCARTINYIPRVGQYFLKIIVRRTKFSGNFGPLDQNFHNRTLIGPQKGPWSLDSVLIPVANAFYTWHISISDCPLHCLTSILVPVNAHVQTFQLSQFDHETPISDAFPCSPGIASIHCDVELTS